jgi:PAS domain S-box-containing protein
VALHPAPEERVSEVVPRTVLPNDKDSFGDLIDLVEHSQDLLCLHDLHGSLLYVNPAPARGLGSTVEELLQIPMRELAAPEFRAQFDEYLNQIARNGEARGLMSVLTKSGGRRIWEFHNTLRTEGVDSPVVRGVAHDVTERHRAEKRLQEYQRVVEGLDEIIVVVDRNYRYLIANHTFLKTRGLEKEQVIGHLVEEIIGKELFDNIVKPRMDECFQGKVVRYELDYVFPHGGERRIFASYFPIEGPSGVDRLALILQDITERKRAEEELRIAKEKLAEEKLYLEETIDTELGFGEIIGQSRALKDVMQQVARVADTNATVLILGETGTGKELMPRAIHARSKRQGSTFIKMNCAAIPSGLLESELFGHEKGAFTGAVSKKVGRLELADRGTLFLDEIGEIPMPLQPKLLRVLQDQEFERLGGTQTLKVNFRLIAATNRDIAQSVREGQFRSDLFYRLNVFPVRVPPLRERAEDIPLLVQYFVRKFAVRMNKTIISIPTNTMETLKHWHWPGNIRELENFIERSVILTQGSRLQSPLKELESARTELVTEPELEDDTLEATDREHIVRALKDTRGKLSGAKGAAKRLGMKRTTLQSKLKRLGVDPRRFAE